MTEQTKNRIAAVVFAVAALSLCAALAAQWWPHDQQVIIKTGEPYLTVATTTPTTAATTTATTTATRFSINEATYGELLTLPLMTDNVAISILAFRYHHLGFASWDDLLKVDGVTAAMVEEWKTLVDLV
ncbi:MAG: helix-hairpin-helix domain-containing protein [Clostridia bacterium]|nr:helix-hairpin-helix domain-containing protein [Clostridia bacterium]